MSTSRDAATQEGQGSDTGRVDAAPIDAGSTDVGPTDVGPTDVGPDHAGQGHASGTAPVGEAAPGFDDAAASGAVSAAEAALVCDAAPVSKAVPAERWRAPRLWRFLLGLSRGVMFAVGRLRVTGDLSGPLRDGPVLFAINHIGPFDPVAFVAASRVRRLTPRLMATGGLFRAPIVGAMMRHCGHIRVNRRQADVANALVDVTDALARGSHVAGYPEGRITLDPGMWPERGKTGMARVALQTGVPVVPVVQWGAHEVTAWGDRGAMAARTLRSIFRRPVVRVHFGAPVDLSDLVDGVPGAAQRATDRIIDALTDELRQLRTDEPRLPAYIDPVRPLSVARRHRPRSDRPAQRA
jgi:1-acyl-sn-glycerol-3-phosphate acyltransferase